MTMGEILPEAARRFGDKASLVVESESLSFSELETMSNRVANGLVSVGVLPGDRVTLYGPNCWEWIVAYYAIAKTGAVVNPISSMLTEEVRACDHQRIVVDSRTGDHAASPCGRGHRLDRGQPCHHGPAIRADADLDLHGRSSRGHRTIDRLTKVALSGQRALAAGEAVWIPRFVTARPVAARPHRPSPATCRTSPAAPVEG